MENEYIIRIAVAGTILFVVSVFFLVAYLIVHKRKQNVSIRRTAYCPELIFSLGLVQNQQSYYGLITNPLHFPSFQANRSLPDSTLQACR